MDNTLTFAVGLAAIKDKLVTSYDPPRLYIEDDILEFPLYLFKGNREDCIKKVVADINQFFDAVEKDFAESNNQVEPDAIV